MWTRVRPYLDERTTQGAREIGLPEDSEELAHHAPGGQVAVLAAALVRLTLDDKLRDAL